jgi:glycosyltransferase involved in cell wall biosynthesis
MKQLSGGGESRDGCTARPGPTVRDHGRDAPDHLRTVTLFVEARFGIRPDGRCCPLDPANGPVIWDRYRRSGVDLRLVARAKPVPDPEFPGLGERVELAPLPYYVGIRGMVRALPRLAVACLRELRRAETIIVRLPGPIGLLVTALCLVTRRRFGVELVGDPDTVLASGSLGRPGRVLARPGTALTRWAVRRARAVLYVTGHTLQEKYPHHPAAVTANVSGVRLDARSFLQGKWRQSGSLRLITLGSQELPYKGHDVLLLAVQRLRRDGIPVTAVIVGGGRLHELLVQLADQLGLSSFVTFTGAVHDRERVRDLLDDASMFVLPSRTEGLPRALLEAMARGLPCIASGVGGIPELLDAEFLVPPGDPDALARAIAALCKDSRRCEAQSRRNQEVAHRFASEVLDARLQAWLDELPPARPATSGDGRPTPSVGEGDEAIPATSRRT